MLYQGDVPEDASDARFDVPYVEPVTVQPDDKLFTHRPERGQSQTYVDPSMTSGFTEPEDLPRPMFAQPGVVWSGQGLVWRMRPGHELPDIGRGFAMPDALADFHSVDLKTIMAHLDSAAHEIKMELDRRYRNGGR